jgi:pimeloyl-ACP methyl ester carboxylesterase
MWDEQIEFFKDKFRVITYDVRGLGKSYVDNNEIYSMESYADDLIFIIKEMKLEKVNACGLSMGGYIMLRAIDKSPELFSKIILSDTKAENDDNTGLLNRSNMLKKLFTEGKDFILPDFLAKVSGEESLKNERLQGKLKDILSNQNADGIAKALTAIALRLNQTEALSKINIPALILVGDRDKGTPIPASEKMNSLIPNSEMKIISNAGHFSNIENPEEFNRTIYKFLNTN